jgi:hypothetical protein
VIISLHFEYSYVLSQERSHLPQGFGTRSNPLRHSKAANDNRSYVEKALLQSEGDEMNKASQPNYEE